MSSWDKIVACCPEMGKARQVARLNGCTPHLSVTSERAIVLGAHGWETDYDGPEVPGVYISACDDTLRVPIEFCPWCGQELKLVGQGAANA